MESFFSKDPIGSYIAGEFIETGKETKPFISYVTKKKEKDLILADTETIAQALIHAEKGSEALENLTAYEKSAILEEISELLKKERETIAQMITLEMGKPIQEARGEVEYAATYFKWFSEEAKRIYGKIVPSQFPHKRLRVVYEPIGPVVIVTPWNYPLAMAARKIAAAWAAGCPIIAKPSSTTPLTLLLFAAIAKKCKALPKEALSVLIGPGDVIADQLMASPIIRKVSITGGLKAGQNLYRLSADTLKKATMELGGNAPFIVFDDIDLAKTIENAYVAKFRVSGQRCTAPNRFIIHENVQEAFIQAFKQKLENLKIGNPFDEDTDLSVSIHPTTREKAKRHVENAIELGATKHLSSDAYYQPQILSGVTPDMQIFKEENFGPIVAITSFKEEKEAINLANKTHYGLASYLFTQNISRAERVSSKLKFGIVGINDGRVSTPQLPLGGVKYSGFGREGGSLGVYEYLIEKTISLVI